MIPVHVGHSSYFTQYMKEFRRKQEEEENQKKEVEDEDYDEGERKNKGHARNTRVFYKCSANNNCTKLYFILGNAQTIALPPKNC